MPISPKKQNQNVKSQNIHNLRAVNNNSGASTKENSLPPKGHKAIIANGNTSD